MKLTNFVFCLALFAGLTTSCNVREHLSDCVVDIPGTSSTNKLILSYKGDGTTEIFPDKICRVELFIFDAENRCVNSTLLPDDQVANRTAVLPTLDPGVYRIICLGNTHATQVEGLNSGDYSQMIFAAEDYFAGGVVSTNDSLYYASIYYTVREAEDGTQTIEFVSSHYDLSVEVIGLPDLESRAADPAAIEVRGLVPCTNFENQICGETTDYLLDGGYEGGAYQAFANIMRLTDFGETDVELYYDGELLAQVNLAEFLAANPVIDCSKQEVLIPIRIEFKSGEITVTVPGWYTESVSPEY